MVSEWMTRGNIREFTKADTDVDRLGLVRCLFPPVVPIPPIIDNLMMGVVERRRQGVDLYARPENNPWGFERGTFPEIHAARG
jgi:hypothetical protein